MARAGLSDGKRSRRGVFVTSGRGLRGAAKRAVQIRLGARSGEPQVELFRRTLNTPGLMNAGGLGPIVIPLTPEGQQREKDRHRLLLEPAQHQRQRQVVDAAVKRLGERHGHHDGAVGVVALAHVQQPRQTQERAVVVVANAELAAAEREDERVAGACRGVVAEVVAARLGAVAAADDEEAADLACLDGLARWRRPVRGSPSGGSRP